MQIRQLLIGNDMMQDRLMLRIASPANEECRVWITRRFLRTMWPHLCQRLQTAPATSDKPKQEKNGNFEEPFRDENPLYPLGSKPLLASEMSFDKLNDGGVRLTFREGRERVLALDFSQELLSALLSMFRASAAKMEWQLPLEYGDSSPAATPSPIPAETPPTTRLH